MIDFIGTWLGGNKGTGCAISEESNRVSETLRIIGGEATVHHCYGATDPKCLDEGVGFGKTFSPPKRVLVEPKKRNKP